MPAGSDHTRILCDLKPALDGYAGIPQETRLLFRSLRSLATCKVEGLIQHGGRQLRAPPTATDKPLPLSRRINRSSRVVVSLPQAAGTSVDDIALAWAAPQAGGKGGNRSTPGKGFWTGIAAFFPVTALQLRALMGLPIRLGLFEQGLFEDFIWRTFFSKTLRPADKGLVTSAPFHVLRLSRKRLHQVGLAGRKWSAAPRYLGVDTRGFDVLLAQTPFPGRVSAGTQLVVRYHDMVPVLMPHTISDSAFHQASHFFALQENVRSGAWFSCVSEATRHDLLKVFPEAEPRTIVIPNIASDEYFAESPSPGVVLQIMRNRQAKVPGFTTNGGPVFSLGSSSASGLDYLLIVSTIEPRKNHLMLIAAWERLKYTSMPQLKLVVVGNLGWGFRPVLDAFRPWAERGDLIHLTAVPSAELRVLYRHAAATICPSLAEGFDYSGIEAMRCGGIVLSSDIPVHREVFGSASVYFDPYSAEDAAEVIAQVLAPDGLPIRERLHAEGPRMSDRYTADRILPQWEQFFEDVKRHQANR
jgi:hypothetical protein